MPAVALTLEPEFAYVVATFVGIYFTNFGLGARVGTSRKSHNVPLPLMYGPDNKQGNAFNCIQRGHQNMHESLADVYVMLFTVGLFFPLYSAKCGVAYIVGRWLYAIGYSKSPKMRSIGQVIEVPAKLALLYGMYCVYAQLQAP